MSNERQPSVRERLVEVAARHFAEYGIQGASQRAIQREACVNVAAAHYYFGSKEELYRAVVETALSTILPARREGLKNLDNSLPRKEKTQALMTAYLSPHLQQMKTETGYYYARMLASLYVVVPDSIVSVVEEKITPLRDDYVDALSKIYPNVSRNRLYEVLRLGAGLMAISPSGVWQPGMSEAVLDRLTDDVIKTATAAFEILCGDG